MSTFLSVTYNSIIGKILQQSFSLTVTLMTLSGDLSGWWS